MYIDLNECDSRLEFKCSLCIVVIMPGLIGIGEFIDETREDYSSPTTSTFVSRMPQCRQTINALEEVCSIILFILYQNIV